MKIQIAKMGEQPIQGYTHVVCSDNYINFMDVSDNECTEILASDILDHFDIDKVRDCLVSLVGKLRLGGKLIVGGKDIRLFCKSVINGAISDEEASVVVQNANSMPVQSGVIQVLKSLGLSIENTNSGGIHFQVTAKRG